MPVVRKADSAIQLISVNETYYAIHWIVIYPMESAIQSSNNQGKGIQLSTSTTVHFKTVKSQSPCEIWNIHLAVHRECRQLNLLGFHSIGKPSVYEASGENRVDGKEIQDDKGNALFLVQTDCTKNSYCVANKYDFTS